MVRPGAPGLRVVVPPAPVVPHDDDRRIRPVGALPDRVYDPRQPLGAVGVPAAVRMIGLAHARREVRQVGERAGGSFALQVRHERPRVGIDGERLRRLAPAAVVLLSEMLHGERRGPNRVGPVRDVLPVLVVRLAVGSGQLIHHGGILVTRRDRRRLRVVLAVRSRHVDHAIDPRRVLTEAVGEDVVGRVFVVVRLRRRLQRQLRVLRKRVRRRERSRRTARLAGDRVLVRDETWPLVGLVDAVRERIVLNEVRVRSGFVRRHVGVGGRIRRTRLPRASEDFARPVAGRLGHEADVVRVIRIEGRLEPDRRQLRRAVGIGEIERLIPGLSVPELLAVVAREEVVDGAVLHLDDDDVLDLRRERDLAPVAACLPPRVRRVRAAKVRGGSRCGEHPPIGARNGGADERRYQSERG